MVPPKNTTESATFDSSAATRETFANSHNYTDCCIQRNVSSHCLGFCNIQSILEGNTGQVSFFLGSQLNVTVTIFAFTKFDTEMKLSETLIITIKQSISKYNFSLS